MLQTNELKTMSISEILEKYPQTEGVFRKFGLQSYASTETARYENLKASALVHSIDLESLIAALVKSIEG